jgi:2-methylcitrate dehydratase PrpD
MDAAAGTLLARISGYGAHDATRELPPEVLHYAKRAVIDWFAALYPGTRMSPAQELVRAHKAELGMGRSSLPGFGTAAHPSLAAWINGSASHSAEFDDIFRDAVYHPGCPVIAAALALAQDRKASGRAFLSAVVVGYEISTRIGVAVQPSHYRFFHTTGTVGAFGSAAAGAALTAPGNADVMAHAIATAGTFAAGLQQAFRSDSMTKPLHAGHAAQVGVQAAMAAAEGVTGALDILEGSAGFGAAMSEGGRWERATDGLGERYNIMRMTQKAHGCCGHAFAAIDAAMHLRPLLALEDIDAIEVEGYKATVDVAGIRDPKTPSEARFSTPYLVAYGLVHGSPRIKAFEDIHDPHVRALMQKVRVREDRDLTARFPGERTARVTITTRDGRRREHFSPCRKGDPEAPLSDDDIGAKFEELVTPILGVERAARLLRHLWVLEERPMPDEL